MTPEERKIYNKKYYLENKTIIDNRTKVFIKENKDAYNLYQREYQKKYRLKNKTILKNAYKKKKYPHLFTNNVITKVSENDNNENINKL